MSEVLASADVSVIIAEEMLFCLKGGGCWQDFVETNEYDPVNF